MAAAVAVGAVNLLPVFISIVSTASVSWPWWMSAAYLVLFVPAAAIGGWLAIRGRSESVDDDAADSADLDPVQP
jgi:protein-S-isoprenylcysteine O-methyltransferase Ste14